MCSEGSSLFPRLPTTQRALVFIVGLWALGHQLCPVLLCWLHWPCCEMWSVSSIRAWTGCRWRAKRPNPWLHHPGVHLQGLVGARSVRCLVVWWLGMRPRCLVVVVSQLCLLSPCSSLHCMLNKFDMLDTGGLCNCLRTLLCLSRFDFISLFFFFFISNKAKPQSHLMYFTLVLLSGLLFSK